MVEVGREAAPRQAFRAYGGRRPTVATSDQPRPGRVAAWTWLAGAAVALAVLGPAAGPGSVFTLDAAFVPHLPVPSGVWGLGPELPRRVPLGLALSWLSSAVGGPAAGKLLLGLCLVVAFVGAGRLVGSAPAPVQLGSGLLYCLSPLVLTRVGAGEWTALAAFAVLPWALPTLLEPSRMRRRTFGWAVAMAATGSVGGVFSLVIVSVALIAEGRRRSLLSGGVVVLAQVPWVIPALIVASSGPHPAGSAVFATRARGLVGLAGLLAGHGFWRAPTQVGGDSGPGTAMLGVGLLGLAILGAAHLPGGWWRRQVAVAAVGLAVELGSVVPGVRAGYDMVTSNLLGGSFREGQRFAALTLVWLAPAAALGAWRLASAPGRAGRWVAMAVPSLVAVVLGFPGLWGVGGRLKPVAIPIDWEAARATVRDRPGPVLALPFHRYFDLPPAGDRRSLNPLPDFLGGDVLSSSDPELGPNYREFDDPRERGIVALLARSRAGQPIGTGLARAGIRWVVLLHAADWQSYQVVAHDSGLWPVVLGPTVELWAVRSWVAPVVDDMGRPVALTSVVAPWKGLAASPAAIWGAPAAWGWLRGGQSASQTPEGLIRLPSGRGPLWFWPSLVVAGADVATLVALCWPLTGAETSETEGD